MKTTFTQMINNVMTSNKVKTILAAVAIVFGTLSASAQSFNHAPNWRNNNNVRIECNKNHKHGDKCMCVIYNGHNRVTMSYTMYEHMKEGKHNFNKQGMCKKCKRTERDIQRFDRMNNIHRRVTPFK